MDFGGQLRDWLMEALKDGVPQDVKAFSFNLFEFPETDDVKFGIELVGAGTFDEHDSDWACDEVWEPTTRAIEIPVSFSGRSWEDCLSRSKELILHLINTEPCLAQLKVRQGVGIGFVDGELDIICRN